ncbi:MAG: histidine kinase [Burkholderiaceae bacterium]
MSAGALLREGLQVAIACVAIAGILRFAVPAVGQYGFVSSLVHSLAIGLTAWSLLGVAARRLDIYGLRPRWLIVPILFLAGPLAYFIGSFIAHLALRLPFDTLSNPKDLSIVPVSLLVSIIATLIFTIYFYGRERLADLRAEAAEEAHRAEAARLAMLRAQIEPHMLFNTLSAVRELVREDPDAAVHMLDHLTDFMRATLAGSRTTVTSLSREFELLEHYLALMRMRMGERLRSELTLPEALRSQVVPTLLLQPLVENAIRHGLEPAIDGGTILVDARRRGDALELTVEDTGVGLGSSDPSADGHPPGNGFGMSSVRDRLKALHGEHADMCIESPVPGATRGTRITLRLPIDPGGAAAAPAVAARTAPSSTAASPLSDGPDL